MTHGMRLAPLLLLAAAAGCYASSSDDEAATDDAATDESGADDAGGRDDGREFAEEDCAMPTCFADFPCRSTAHCLDPSTVESCRSIPCWETCGTTCCSGASCGSSGRTPCPAGWICVEAPSESWPGDPEGTHATCTPPPESSPDAGVVDAGPDAGGSDPPSADAGAAEASASDGRRFKESIYDPGDTADVPPDLDWDVWHVPETYRTYCI